MNAILADLRQPTCTEALSPAMQAYLRQRVRVATGEHLPQRWDIKLYQCLGDERSAATLCEDLLDFVADDPQGISGIVAVFECSPCTTDTPFAANLQRHLQLMHSASPDLALSGDSAALDANENIALRIAGRPFQLIVLHADAQRLSRVMPCPVLVFSAL